MERPGSKTTSPENPSNKSRPAGILPSYKTPALFRPVCGQKKGGGFVRTDKKERRTPLLLSRSVFRSRSGDLAGTQAAGAGVNTAGLAVDNCLNLHHVGFPGPVGPSMGVGNTDPESHVLAAEITFCHLSAPPSIFHIALLLYQV